MAGKTILYRGSLKSCNYHCFYCPFSKHRMAERELEQDKAQWRSFTLFLTEHAHALRIRALMVVPYGEALLHPWYWEGLAQVSACPAIDAVGAQTNLSFPIESALSDFDRHGGKREKLRLWATFHPEMTTADDFVSRCQRLASSGVTLCAGAVGVPKHIGLLLALRKKLPQDIYLWINKMDGLKRPYTKEEQDALRQIDPYFIRELTPFFADEQACKDRLFVEGNGTFRTCNISKALPRNPKTDALLELPKPQCGRKLCSCYLAYGGRSDFMNQILFGPYPLFRIPRRPKAVFFDIEGTLLQNQESKGPGAVPRDIMAGLTALFSQDIPLFFATTLPYPKARMRCSQIWHLFSGGIFAGGAHILLKKEKKELFWELKDFDYASLALFERKFHFRTRIYRYRDKIYKITLLRSLRHPWRQQHTDALNSCFPALCRQDVRYFTEGSALEIVAANATKAGGIRTVCSWLEISPEDAAAAGNSAEDEEMLALCNC